MKTLLKIVIAAMFGIEICSPFFIGYLNQKEKTRKMYSRQETKNDIVLKDAVKAEKDWENIDFTGHNYSDSKTYLVRE